MPTDGSKHWDKFNNKILAQIRRVPAKMPPDPTNRPKKQTQTLTRPLTRMLCQCAARDNLLACPTRDASSTITDMSPKQKIRWLHCLQNTPYSVKLSNCFEARHHPPAKCRSMDKTRICSVWTRALDRKNKSPSPKSTPGICKFRLKKSALTRLCTNKERSQLMNGHRHIKHDQISRGCLQKRAEDRAATISHNAVTPKICTK